MKITVNFNDDTKITYRNVINWWSVSDKLFITLRNAWRDQTVAISKELIVGFRLHE